MSAATTGLTDLAGWLLENAGPRRREGADFAGQDELAALADGAHGEVRRVPGWLLLVWRTLEEAWTTGRLRAPSLHALEAWRAELQRSYWRGWDRGGGGDADNW